MRVGGRVFEIVGATWAKTQRLESTGNSQKREGDFVGTISIWEMKNKFGNITWGHKVKSLECQDQDADSYLR